MLLRLTALHPQGTHQSIPIDRFNGYFDFVFVTNNPERIRACIADPEKLVIRLDITILVYWYRYFFMKGLKEICSLHRIPVRKTKEQVIQDLMTHTCNADCQGMTYVFKSMSRPRSNVHLRFKPPAEHTETSSTRDLSTEENIVEGDREQETSFPISSSDTNNLATSTDHLEPLDEVMKRSIIKQWQSEMSGDALRRTVCCACSKIVAKDDSEWLDGNSIDLELLQNNELDNEIKPRGYNLNAYKQAILNPKGLEYTDRVGNVRLCSGCSNALKAKKMPKFALSNWLYYGMDALPENLKKAFDEATMFDRMLICRARANSVVCKFNTKDEVGGRAGNNVLSQARKGVRGNILVTPLDAVKMNDVLPPGPESIRDTMCAIFVGSQIPTVANVTKFSPILIRKSRVKTMITFLLEHNPHYTPSTAFQFSANNFQNLLDGGTDEGVPCYVQIGQIPLDDAVAAATSDYTPRNVDTYTASDVNTASEDVLMENVGYTEGDGSPIAYHAMKTKALQHCLERRPVLIAGSGSTFVPDFQNPSLLSWLFPHLDPWGIGGFHHPSRRIRLSMEEQVSHLLRVDNSPFERDSEFAFVCYNIIRKSSVANTVRFSLPSHISRNIAHELIDVDVETLASLNTASQTDPSYTPQNDDERKAFRLLAELRLAARHVPGSDGYKVMLRNQIRAIIQRRGTPSLFITINPADVDHPLVRFLAGEDIDLDDVSRGEDLNEWQRKLFAAKHPAACAQFFDLMIRKFISVILRYGCPDRGAFGKCTSYFGTVEAQGKGTLHCHMLIWLEGHASPQSLRDKMKESDEYRDQVFRWLESVIKCEFPEEMSIEQARTVHSNRIRHSDNGDPHPGTIPLPNLHLHEHDMPLFWRSYSHVVDQLLHQYNWHEHTDTCWKYLKRGQEKCDANCRMGMDGSTHPTTSLDPETGKILLRRHHPKISAYTDIGTFLLQCNINTQYVGSGEQAKAYIYYVTDYITKSSLPLHVGMAALAYAVKKAHDWGLDTGVRSGSDKHITGAVIMAVNSMMARHEISHPQVMSYLVGGGDHYTPEKFSVMQWGAIARHVNQAWTADQQSESPELTAQGDGGLNVVIEPDEITISNQQLDYSFRNEAVEYAALCLYDFIARVYKVRLTEQERRNGRVKGMFNGLGHPQQETHHLSIRRIPHIPVLLGPSIPNPEKSGGEKEEWATYMLILFKPWREPLDLKREDQGWIDAFEEFRPQLSEIHQTIIKNMTVLTECSDAREHYDARGRRANPGGVEGTYVPNIQANAAYQDIPESILDAAFSALQLDSMDVSENNQSSAKSALIEKLGTEVCRQLDMCLPEGENSEVEVDGVQRCTRYNPDEDENRVRKCELYMNKKRERKRKAPSDMEVDERPSRRQRQTSPVIEIRSIPEGPLEDYKRRAFLLVEEIIEVMNLEGNPEQLRAFKLVANQLILRTSPQLLLYVGGVGGTGKSHVIKCIVMLFKRLNRLKELSLGAPTGTAATSIGGQTLHSLILSGPNGKGRKINQGLLADIWCEVSFLIVDEVSMVGAPFLDELSLRIRMGKGADPSNREKPFGGINVIFMGDFGQLEPAKQYSLFSHKLVKNPSYSESRSSYGIEAMNGAFLWRLVSHVIELKKNVRQGNDLAYASFLQRLRVRKCFKRKVPGQADDEEYLNSRLLSKLQMQPEALEKFWDTPIIVGSRVVRDALNARLVEYHAGRQGMEVSLYYSRDTVKRRTPSSSLQKLLWEIPSAKNFDAFGYIPMFIGMKVMVTENIAFDNGIVNGSEGTLVELKYEEFEGRRYATVAFVCIKGSGINAPGEEDSDVVPIFPSASSVQCTEIFHPELKTQSFRRRQLPLIPAYAYTDYKSQGRTLERAIVDLATAHGQGAYVMLSRVKSLTGLVILRWFPSSKIHGNLSEDLRNELERLNKLEITSTTQITTQLNLGTEITQRIEDTA